MITAREYDVLVEMASRPVAGEFIDEPWARVQPRAAVAHEVVVEAVEDLIAAGCHVFTVRQVWALVRDEFGDGRRGYGSPCWSTVDSGLRKMADAGLIRLRACGRPGGHHPRTYEASRP